MTNPLRDRRRVERFAQLLEEADGGRRHRRHSPLDQELGKLVRLRQELVDQTPAPEQDQEFRAGLRAMLVATAEREGIGATAAPTPEPAPAPAPRPSLLGLLSRGPRARTAVVAGVAAGAVAFAGMSSASGSAVPGDTLYGVKRSAERAQLALASSDMGRAQLYLDFAQTRLAEAHSVAEGLDRVLADMDRDTQAGVRLLTTAAAHRRDPAALNPIERFVTDQRLALDRLAAEVGPAGQQPITQSLELLDEVEQRADDLRYNLDRECPSATSIDALGPLPGACLTLPAPDSLDDTGSPSAQPPGWQPDGSGHTDQAAGGSEANPERAGGSEPEEPASERSTSSGAAATTHEPDQSTSTGEQDPAATDPDQTDDDGGLLSGINRLLGNLLGG